MKSTYWSLSLLLIRLLVRLYLLLTYLLHTTQFTRALDYAYLLACTVTHSLANSLAPELLGMRSMTMHELNTSLSIIYNPWCSGMTGLADLLFCLTAMPTADRMMDDVD